MDVRHKRKRSKETNMGKKGGGRKKGAKRETIWNQKSYLAEHQEHDRLQTLETSLTE